MAPKKNRATRKKGKSVPPLVAPVLAMSPTPRKASSGKLNFVFWVIAALCVGLFLLKKNNLSAENFSFNLKLFKKDIPVTEVKRIELDKLKGGASDVWGLCALGKDQFAASDDVHTKIVVFDENGNLLRSFGQKGPLKTDLHQIRGISSDASGNLYVLDTETSFISGFTPMGKPIGVVDTSPTGYFYGPNGLSCVGNNFAIADTGSHRVVTVDREGKTVSSWGGHGTGDTQFQSPGSVLVDQQNHYYVADCDNKRIKIQDSNGKNLKIISLDDKPAVLALDQSDRLYVSFEVNRFIQVYSASTGGYIGDMVVQNPDSDESYKQVNALCVTGDGLLVAANESNIWIYRLPPAAGK